MDYSQEYAPEELNTLLLQEYAFATVQSIEELDSGQNARNDNVSRVDQN